MKNRSTIRIVSLLFFLSGACGLVYENIWFKILRLIFGNTTHALSTVLASFMAGLALGSWLFGRYIDSASRKATQNFSSTREASKESYRNPIVVYGLLEIAIGILCLGTVYLKDIVEVIYLGMYRSVHPPLFGLHAIRFAVSFVLLVLPTMCMGGTLPVLSKFFIHRLKAVGREIALLYSLNTLGACTGVVVSGFFLFPNMGISRVIILAAGVNILIGIVSLFVARSYHEPIPAKEEGAAVEDAPAFSGAGVLLLCGFGLSGAVSMIYEVSWTRVYGMLLGSSAYAFTVVLATFLLGLVIGSAIYKKFLGNRTVRLSGFGIVQIAIAALVAVLLPLIQEIPFLFIQLYKLTRGQYYLFQASTSFLCAILMLLPTIAIGMTFPLVSQLYVRNKERLGGQIGNVYAVNTIGNILGALIAGFLLVPMIGIHRTLVVGVGINCIAGLMVWLGENKQLRKRAFVAAVAVCLMIVGGASVYRWPKKLLASGIQSDVKAWRNLSRRMVKERVGVRKQLYYKEGLNATVSVDKVKSFIVLKVNGKPDASTMYEDMTTQTLAAYIPLLFVDDPKNVFILGLGSGVTVSASTDFAVERIDLAEIEPAVVEASRYFKQANKDILRDRRVHLYLEDGRNYLLRKNKRYDVIVSEPPNPWFEGVASLFTREYYRLLKSCLAPDGVVCQWIQLYALETDDVKRILRTFHQVFPYVSAWKSMHTDMLIVGSARPLFLDFKRLESLFAQPVAKARMDHLGFTSPISLVSAFLFDQDKIGDLVRQGPVNTDDFNRLEYSAPRALFKDTSEKNLFFLFDRQSRREDLFTTEEEKRDKDSVYTRMSYIIRYLGQFDTPRARFEVQSLLRDFPGDIEKYFNLVYALQGDKDDSLAFQTIHALIQREEKPVYYYYLGMLYNKSKMSQEAAVALYKAIALQPQELKPYLLLSEVFKEQKKYPQAVDVLQQALKYHPSNRAVMKRISECEKLQ